MKGPYGSNKSAGKETGKTHPCADFWKNILTVAPTVEEIEIGMDGNYGDLPYILDKLNVFKKLKILNILIKLKEMEVEEKKRAIENAVMTMIKMTKKRELPKKLKASVREILATFDSKEEGTNKDDPEVHENPELNYINQRNLTHLALTLFDKEANEDPQFVQIGRNLIGLRKPNSEFVTHLDFESKIDWVDLHNKLKFNPKDPREKKIIKHLTLDNVKKSKTSSTFWKKVYNLAPMVEEIEIGMDGHFRDLPYILGNLNVFKELKVLNVFIKIQKMVYEEKYRIVEDAAIKMKQELPKELKALVMEILASFDSKENDLEVPESPDLKQKRHKVLILFEKEAYYEEPLCVQLGPHYDFVEEKVDDLRRQLLEVRQKQSKFVTYLDFEYWDRDDVNLENMLKHNTKIIKCLTIDNVQKSEISATFWEKVFEVAPQVEEIEIGMDGNFRDLPYILGKLHAFKKLKILNVFIKIQEMECELEEKESIIQLAKDTMEQELPKELKASVKEILASFDKKVTNIFPEVPENGSADNSKEKVINKDDPDVPENGSADKSKEKATNKDDPEVLENGSTDNSKEKVTNKDDPEVPENGSADNSNRGEYYFLI